MKYLVDLRVYPKPLIHYKFRQIQQLALNKGFLWEYSGHKILRKYHTSSFTDWHFALDFDKLIISMDCKQPIITYKEAIQKLKALQ